MAASCVVDKLSKHSCLCNSLREELFDLHAIGNKLLRRNQKSKSSIRFASEFYGSISVGKISLTRGSTFPKKLKDTVKYRNSAKSDSIQSQNNGSYAKRSADPIGNISDEVYRGDISELDRKGCLIDNGLVYRERFTIRCYEVGMNRTASIEAIANLLQEVGCNHARSVGFSNDGFATTPLMRLNRLIWVTTRMHIEMDSYPLWGDVVVIDTWFQNTSSILSRRDWIICLNNTKKIIGRATSSWVMMNQDTRKLSRIPEDVKAEYTKFCLKPARYALDSTKSEKIPKLEDKFSNICPNLVPRRGDLDMNQHVNNVTYIGWMLESIPSVLIENAEISQITIEYRQECRSGDCVDSICFSRSLGTELYQGSDSLPEPPNSPDTIHGTGNGAMKSSAVETVEQKSASNIEFIHLLRFNGNPDKEINRGRTIWRIKSDCPLQNL